MSSLNSKTIISALAVIALLATPALAKTRKHQAVTTPGQGIYNTVAPNTLASPKVEADGRVIGADPDPQIRTEMLRDFGSAVGAY
jgi:hypothetical protein